MDTETKTDKRTTQSLKVVNVKMETIYTQGTTHRSTSLCFSQGHGPQKSLNFELKEEGWASPTSPVRQGGIYHLKKWHSACKYGKMKGHDIMINFGTFILQSEWIYFPSPRSFLLAQGYNTSICKIEET